MNEVSDSVETPKSWIWWSLLAAVSASAGNNYFVRGFTGSHIYRANIYVMLIGTSGLGKAFGINLAKSLVAKADITRVIAGRSSVQAIVSELANTRTRQNGKPPFTDSRAFVVNGELSSAIVSDVAALSILTDLYDGSVNEEWVNSLKISGRESLKDPYITALFGSAPSPFYATIPQTNIEGGYIGRNLIVYEEKRSRDIDTFSEQDDKDEIENRIKDYIIPKYSKHLVEIASKKGRLVLTSAARDLFNPWKINWRSSHKNETTGFIIRVPDHVVKVAMCLCLARIPFTGIIEDSDFQIAIDKVTSLIYSHNTITSGKGIDPAAAQTKKVIDILIRADNNELTRKRLLTAGHGDFDAYALDRICETLLDMGWIQKVRHGNDWLIKLAGKPLESYLEWKRKQEMR